MPLNYALPGIRIQQRGARITGAVAVVAALLSFIVIRVASTNEPPGRITVTLRTERVGPGIESGTDVRLDGVNVGAVARIEAEPDGYQRIVLDLAEAELFGLTDALDIDYAPGNLFGISEVELLPRAGGIDLVDNAVVDLTGDRASRVSDVTMSTMLQSIGQLTDDVLTPKLASVLAMIANQTRAFTPLIQTIIVTATLVADTQRLPASFLLGQFGQTLQGFPSTADGTVRLLWTAYENEYMKSDDNRRRFDATIAVIRDDLLPTLTTVLGTGGQYYSGHSLAVVPLLDAIARTVPTPDLTGAQLGELLDRTDRAFQPTPDGPVVRVDADIDIDLGLVPGLAGPLQAGAPPLLPGGPR
ncbi:MlaD family protein [Nocardia sp. NPDC058379]|uniref:MlaD family protein n=1 Tax=unclassified Nocardia TaxID=2637762 RepID=UPI003654365E